MRRKRISRASLEPCQDHNFIRYTSSQNVYKRYTGVCKLSPSVTDVRKRAAKVYVNCHQMSRT